MEIVLEQGYVVENIAAMWYKSLKDETDVGLRMLHTDKDAMDMARIGMRDNIVELFVVHKDAATTRKGCTIEEVENIDGGKAVAPTADTIGPGPIVLYKAQSLAQAKVGKKPKVVTKAQNDVLEDGDEESDEQWSENSSGDTDLEVAFDNNDDDRNGDGGLYDIEVTTTKDPQRPKQSVPTEREQGEHSGSVNKGKEQVVAAGLRDEDDGYESEGLWDVPVSDDEGDPLLRRYPLYKSLKNMKEYKWEVGTMYVDRNAFKKCVTSYAVHSGRGIWFSKCDNHRCKAVCKEGCKWFAYCHKMKREDTWQLTSCYQKHTCSKATKIGIMSPQWLTARVKQQSLDEINGTYGEQYRRIHDYAAELLRSNPGSTVQIQVERPPEFELETPTPGTDMRPRFQRIYICLDACKRSFMVCRPMIGLDGCFIKTPYGGQLLTSIGWDPMIRFCQLPMLLLKQRRKTRGDIFVESGLIPTFDELLPGIDHRFCVRHLYSNFIKRFPGVQLKMMMSKAAKATYVQDWERRMKEIQQVDQGSYNHLMEILTKYWSKSRFNYFPRVDTLVNNMCECFNSVIVEAREKPIVSMLEDIRVYLMNRWSDNRQSIVTYAGKILPKINKKIEREFDKGGEWLAIYAGRDKYEVSSSQGNRAKFVVDLNLHECSCRKFQLTGYPCEHAMSCIRKMCLDVKNYVNKCYRKDTGTHCYSFHSKTLQYLQQMPLHIQPPNNFILFISLLSPNCMSIFSIPKQLTFPTN
ncbi:hypothetical protein Ahy_B03g065405 [Arachis hypogaea]|uniref:SWIM-type domain-containing protein n=1 Tax=Arachis hypogaea TaxID=3818 RepID=A0A445A1I0_ARAHY|nr:hypothetical protein Ahy_B03g065405 [Arachis hypogaea]